MRQPPSARFHRPFLACSTARAIRRNRLARIFAFEVALPGSGVYEGIAQVAIYASRRSPLDDLLFARIANIEKCPVVTGLRGGLDFAESMQDFVEGWQVCQCDQSINADQFARSILDFSDAIGCQQNAIAGLQRDLRS